MQVQAPSLAIQRSGETESREHEGYWPPGLLSRKMMVYAVHGALAMIVAVSKELESNMSNESVLRDSQKF